MFTDKPHWIHSQPEALQSKGVLECGFKFQHVEEIVKCSVYEGDRGLIIKLYGDKRSLTPGQYAVLYSDNECLGGAKILHSPINFILDYLKNKSGSCSGEKNDEDCKIDKTEKEKIRMEM